MGGTLNGCCEKRDDKSIRLKQKSIINQKKMNPIN